MPAAAPSDKALTTTSPPVSQTRVLHAPQLLFAHAEVVSDFVDDRHADFAADLRVSVADGLNILLIQHNASRPSAHVENALVCGRRADEHSQHQSARTL